MNCLWGSFTGGTRASPTKKNNRSRSIQLILGRVVSVIACHSNQGRSQKTYAGSGLAAPGTRFIGSVDSQDHLIANPITWRAASVNALACPWPAAAKDATPAVVAEADWGAVDAIG